MARIPGRKNLVWVSSGFPGYIQESMERYINAAARAIGDADVVVYPVSAMGLLGQSQTSAPPRSLLAWRRDTPTGPQITNYRQTSMFYAVMNSLAEQTGGHAFYDRNDLDTAIRTAADELASTYTLAFRPSHEEWNGEYRKLRVQLRRKGLKARHRPGYVASPDGAVDGRDADAVLADAFANPLDSTGVELNVSAESVDASVTRLLIHVEAPTITLAPAQDRWKGELLIAIVPAAGDGPGKPQVQRVGIDLPGARYEQVMQGGVMFTRSIPVADLARGLRVFVLDVKSRRVGSVDVR
jgi:hypothetical protein